MRASERAARKDDRPPPPRSLRCADPLMVLSLTPYVALPPDTLRTGKRGETHGPARDPVHHRASAPARPPVAHRRRRLLLERDPLRLEQAEGFLDGPLELRIAAGDDRRRVVAHLDVGSHAGRFH